MSEELVRLKNCIRTGFELESTLASGETALYLASHLGLREQVEHMLQAGANPDPSSYERHTPLHLAAVSCEVLPFCERREHDEAARLECCRLLLKAGADVNARVPGACSGVQAQPYLLFCHLQRSGASAVPFLVTIPEEGTPAPRLMACKALAQIGEEKLAKRGLADLLDCEEVVTWRSGCSVSNHPASFLAGWTLEHPDRNF